LHCYKSLTAGELPKFTAANNFQFGNIPEQLSILSEIEMHLISQVLPFVTVVRLDGGQYGTSGNVVNFENDILYLVKHLPRALDNISLMFGRVRGHAAWEYVIRPPRICAALVWLKENNPLYADVIIDEDVLACMGELAAAAAVGTVEIDPVPSDNVEMHNADEESTGDKVLVCVHVFGVVHWWWFR
jgi:hypothetical protein